MQGFDRLERLSSEGKWELIEEECGRAVSGNWTSRVVRCTGHSDCILTVAFKKVFTDLTLVLLCP